MEKFNPLRVSSKFATCGMPLTADTYRGCSFQCDYCFSNGRVVNIAHKGKSASVPNIRWVEQKLNNIHNKGKFDKTNFLDMLIKNKITWHVGGLSDPFQPAEETCGYTRDLVKAANVYDHSILFSTKGNTLHHPEVYDPRLHSFQLSATNTVGLFEQNVPSISSRAKFFKKLKDDGFRVGVRIQPFIPGVTDTRILMYFPEADHYIIEGMKLVPQNKKQRDYIMQVLGLTKDDFVTMGLMHLKQEQRLALYEPFIKEFQERGYSYSISDKDLRYLGNNKCCCGDKLVTNSTNFNSTYVIQSGGMDNYENNLLAQVGEYKDCKVKSLFTSNRSSKFDTVQDFIEIKLQSDEHPCSKKFLSKTEKKEEAAIWLY